MKQAYFIAGTDTEIGKTFSACALLHRFAAEGYRTIGMKPVAAGLDAQGRNEDVEQLLAASSVPVPRTSMNPYALPRPIAPHLAALEVGCEIRFSPILRAFDDLVQQADVVLVEGVGGFRVPLGPDGDSADLALALGLPIILVVGLRLGCINHALLSVEAIRARGLDLAGWIANSIDPSMASREANIASLTALIAAPLLGVLPAMAPPDAARAAACLQLPGRA